MTRTQKSSSLFKTLSRRSLKRDSRSMTLRFETLENRELLSVNPADGAVVATDSNDAAAQLEQNAAEAGSCASIDLSALNLETAAATTETPSAVVTSLLDVVDATDGLITLREALTYAGSEGVVTFSPSLKGGTITLGGAPLTASSSVTIDASALTDSSHSTGITIDANFASRIFDLASGTFELNGLKLVNGLSDKAGAVYIWDNAAVTIKDSILSGNSASADNSGGAIRLDYSTLAIQNSLIVNNFSTGNYSGGAICNYGNGTTLNVKNSTIANNAASKSETAGALFMNRDNNYKAGVANLYNTIVAGNTGGSSDVRCRDNYGQVNAYNVLSTFTSWSNTDFVAYYYDPVQPLFYDASEGDYSLDVGSQAVNRGKNTYVDYKKDLAGNTRTVNGTVDLGAFEVQNFSNIETPSTVVTTLDDVVDATDGLISLREAITYAKSGRTITFDPSLAGGVITLCGEPLVIEHSVTIDASSLVTPGSMTGITIDADYASRALNLVRGTFELRSISFVNGVSDIAGAVYIWDNATVTIKDSVLSGNSASANNSGGAIRLDYSTLTIQNSLIVNNFSTGNYSGGAICNYGNDTTLNVKNSTIANNAAPKSETAGALFMNRDNNYKAGVANLYNTIVAGNTGGSSDVRRREDMGQVNAYNVLSTYTSWTNTDSVAYYYDPVQPLYTNVANSDFTLAVSSQAIDRGNKSYVVFKKDLAGNTRTVNGTVDLGAFEVQNFNNIEAPSTVVTTLDDIVDATDGLISLREAITYAKSGRTITFDPSLAGGTITLCGEPLVIEHSITIDASDLTDSENITGITISANLKSRVLNLVRGTFELRSISFVNGVSDKAGAVYIWDNAAVIIKDSILSGNSASADNSGGAIRLDYSTLAIQNSLIINNFSAGNNSGGAINNVVGTLNVKNSTIASNAASKSETGGALFITRDNNLKAGVVNLYNTIIAGNTGGSLDIRRAYGQVNAYNVLSTYTSWTNTDAVAYSYDSSQPLFVDPANGNFALSVSSQAIDRGDNHSVNFLYDIAGNPRVQNDVVDLGAYEYDPEPKVIGTITVSQYDAATSTATLKWSAISEAETYKIQMSTDGGTTWTDYATNLTNLYKQVRGISVGNSYDFRVYGISSSSTPLKVYYERTFAPISASSSTTAFTVGTPITISVSGASDASSTIKWYRVTANGDAEIVSAANQRTYTPDSSEYDVKAVVEGVDYSLGCKSELVFTKPSISLGNVSLTRYTYTDEVHQALVKWPAYEGATYYNLEYSTDGGATWTLYAKNFANKYKGVNGVYPGKTYDFRVKPLDSAKQPMIDGYITGTFAPVVLTNAAQNYSAGVPIQLTRLASDAATSTIKWYYVKPSGNVEIVAARNQLSFTPTTAEFDIKVVSTGTGVSLKSNYELTIAANSAISFAFDYNPATRKATMTWSPIDGAATYSVKISKDDGATWTTYRSGLTSPEIVVSGLYTGKTYGFRVTGISSSQTTLATFQTTFSPSTNASSLIDEAFADFFEEELTF